MTIKGWLDAVQLPGERGRNRQRHAAWQRMGDAEKQKANRWLALLIDLLVGARGFEPPTPCTPCRYATRLRYAPTNSEIISELVQILEFL